MVVTQVAHRLPQVRLRGGAEDLRGGALRLGVRRAEQHPPAPDRVLGPAYLEANGDELSVESDGGEVVDDRFGRIRCVVACPDSRHATTHLIRPKRSSTTSPPSDSTDNSSPFASRYAGPRTGYGAGGCCSARRTPRRSAPPRRSSAPPRSRTCGRRCATCVTTIYAICTARCSRCSTRWTLSGSCGTTCRTPWPRSSPKPSCSCSAPRSMTRKR